MNEEDITQPKTPDTVPIGTVGLPAGTDNVGRRSSMDNSEEGNNIQTDADEEKEITEVKKKYYLTPKFQRWVELFLDKSNNETFGNATRAALQAYNLDEEKQYSSASDIGYKNMRKVENLGSMYAAKKGFGFGNLMDIAMNKAISTDNPGWWDRVAEMIRVRDRKVDEKNSTITNIQINQFQLNSQEVDVLNKEFMTFLDGKYRKNT